MKTCENTCEISLNEADIWVQVYDVPTDFVSETIFRSIGNYIGEFIKSDPVNLSGLWKQFYRLRIRMDVRKSLKRRMKIKREGEEWSWLNFKYERLCTFCFVCGKLGHSERDCDIVYANPGKEMEICKAIYYAGYYVIDAKGHKGGLPLMWRNEGAVEIKGSCDNYIDFEVECDQIGRWRYTGYYGCPERNRRQESWDILRELASKSQLPWCVLCDFNDMLFSSEKWGGRPQPSNLLTEFGEAIVDCELQDLGFIGSNYTWEKSIGDPGWMQEHLDRGLATQDWRQLFSNVEVHVLEVSTSDHFPLLLKLNSQIYVPKSRRFYFENLWIKESECLNIVKDSWNKAGIESIMEKIEYCCLKLDEWGGGKVKELKKNIKNCSLVMRKFRSRRDDFGVHRYNEARWELLKLLQRQEGMQEVITEYFSEFFTTSRATCQLSEPERVQCVTEEQNMMLIQPIAVEEVKHAVFSMHAMKAPGYDGLNPTFYQAYWNVVHDDVVGFCRKFFDTGVMDEEINRTIVCIIPKVKQPQYMTEIRSISLCNVLFRILSKVLANRLKGCLPTIVSANHSAFIEGRLLTDNALIAFEVNHYIKRRTQGNNGVAGLKIDVSKVFTQHGQVFGRVVPQRGIRQGDPISPYIYILCAEALSTIIQRYEEVGLINGCSIARGAPPVTHLLFADNCYLFFKANEGEARTIKNIIKRYEMLSGQVINFSKSAITYSPNTTAQVRENICAILEVVESRSAGKYLGLPMEVGRRKNEVFDFLTERVGKKLQGWKNKTLSKAGKGLLLKTGAQSIPNFWMNLLLIPAEVCNKIQRLMNGFWWESGTGRKGIRWMAWDKLSTVKEGGA
ncbi:uncharacterized protein LOC141691283 [Apium graveolens]|uniref:uncharacterized protein LOC141691283 n=1 Tax=Apium graveolens TaxID=4045 RepID=UPI003D79841E